MNLPASTLAALVIATPVAPVLAMPSALEPPPSHRSALINPATWHRHAHRYGGNGGYKVNRYGYGNFVSGPNGGFAGYPAGSAGARTYRQQEEWKCEAVPESC